MGAKKKPRGKKKLSATEKILTTVDPTICLFCKKGDLEDTHGLKGTLIKTEQNFSVHYFCMLFASGLYQRGDADEENNDLKGFLPHDIVKEKRRADKLRCSFCKEPGAPTGCIERKCNMKYHFECGRKNGVLFQFFGSFCTFCLEHRPHQSFRRPPTKGKRRRLRFVGMAKTSCSICMGTISTRVSANTLCAPCCKKYFHRECLQRMGTCSGYVHFKCPTCNNVDEFRQEMLQFGVYLPDQDAAWELEPNAFGDHYERYNRCDARECLDPEGREHMVDLDGSPYEIVRCQYCGSSAVHWKCNSFKNKYTCKMCAGIRRKRCGKKMKHKRKNALEGDMPSKSADAQKKFKGSTARHLKKTLPEQDRKRKRESDDGSLSPSKRQRRDSIESGAETVSHSDTVDSSFDHYDTESLSTSVTVDTESMSDSDVMIVEPEGPSKSPAKRHTNIIPFSSSSQSEQSAVEVQSSAQTSSATTNKAPKKSIKITSFWSVDKSKRKSCFSPQGGSGVRKIGKKQDKRRVKFNASRTAGIKKNTEENSAETETFPLRPKPKKRSTKRSLATVKELNIELQKVQPSPELMGLLKQDIFNSEKLGSVLAEQCISVDLGGKKDSMQRVDHEQALDSITQHNGIIKSFTKHSSMSLNDHNRQSPSTSYLAQDENENLEELFMDCNPSTDESTLEQSTTETSQTDDTLTEIKPRRPKLSKLSKSKVNNPGSDAGGSSDNSQADSYRKTQKQSLLTTFFVRKSPPSAALGAPPREEKTPSEEPKRKHVYPQKRRSRLSLKGSQAKTCSSKNEDTNEVSPSKSPYKVDESKAEEGPVSHILSYTDFLKEYEDSTIIMNKDNDDASMSQDTLSVESLHLHLSTTFDSSMNGVTENDSRVIGMLTQMPSKVSQSSDITDSAKSGDAIGNRTRSASNSPFKINKVLAKSSPFHLMKSILINPPLADKSCASPTRKSARSSTPRRGVDEHTMVELDLGESPVCAPAGSSCKSQRPTIPERDTKNGIQNSPRSGLRSRGVSLSPIKSNTKAPGGIISEKRTPRRGSSTDSRSSMDRCNSPNRRDRNPSRSNSPCSSSRRSVHRSADQNTPTTGISRERQTYSPLREKTLNTQIEGVEPIKIDSLLRSAIRPLQAISLNAESPSPNPRKQSLGSVLEKAPPRVSRVSLPLPAEDDHNHSVISTRVSGRRSSEAVVPTRFQSRRSLDATVAKKPSLSSETSFLQKPKRSLEVSVPEKPNSSLRATLPERQPAYSEKAVHEKPKRSFEANVRDKPKRSVRATVLEKQKRSLDDAAVAGKSQRSVRTIVFNKRMTPRSSKYSCTQCNMRFKNGHILARHRKHVHEKPGVFSCEPCNIVFKDKYDHIRHRKKVHGQRKTYKCDQCHASFTEKFNRKRHIKSMHETHVKCVFEMQKTHECEKCNSVFRDNFALTMHKRHVHEKRLMFKCNRCDFGTDVKYRLNEHVQNKCIDTSSKATRYKNYRCEQCRSSFRDRHALTCHTRYVHEHRAMYECARCEFGSKLKYNLEDHMKTVHNLGKV